MKRTPPNLGGIPQTEGERDAVHVSVIAMQAGATLRPSQRVGVERGLAVPTNTPIGLVDPFRADEIRTGEYFWMFMLPGTVSDLRHEWSHPDLVDPMAETDLDDGCAGCW